MEDSNADVSDPSMTSFCTLFKLKRIAKEPTCYKNPENPSCIDLFLTNCPRSFQNTCLYETGLSDFHKLVVTILRTSFEPLPPKIIKYRNYKNFDEDEFRFLFKKRLNDFNTDDITVDIFKMTFLNVLNKFAPLKKKYLRANHSRFVNKELNKAIMQRSRLRNAYLKDRTRAARIAYKKQRNVCVSILRKSKKCYYENLDTKNITDNKKFWGTVKPLFSNKVRSNTYITLNEDEKLIKNEYQIANIFNTFFIEIVPNLGTKVDERYLCDASNISDPIEKAIQKYKNHPSISIIKKMVSTVDKNNKFSFEPITADDISQQIKRLDINKATQESDIPTKLVKRFDNLIVDYLQENFNNCLKKGTFPKDFQKAAVHPTHKKDCKTEKSNYRPISILPNLSKICEQLLYEQMCTCFTNFSPHYQYDFRKEHSAQH